MSWERHSHRGFRTSATGDANRTAGLLHEHLANVGCDPLAVRIAARLLNPGGYDDDFEDLGGRLPGCHDKSHVLRLDPVAGRSRPMIAKGETAAVPHESAGSG